MQTTSRNGLDTLQQQRCNIQTLSNASSRTYSQQENDKGGPQSVRGGGGKAGSSTHIFKGAKKKGGGVADTSSISKLYSTPRKHNISSKGGNNESIFTPTKRKLISEGNIQNLIGKFEVNTKSKSSKESDICESPAKRGRWGPWGD